MANYLHGAYGQTDTAGARVSDKSRNAFVYIGTAPVHTVEGGKNNVNVPILINSIAEARKYLGYSDEWDKYTLCEGMHVHLEEKGIAPVIFINVLDPDAHKSDEEGNISITPEKGRVTIQSAENIILDSIVVKSGSEEKKKGIDYGIAYNANKKAITISEVTSGALGESMLTITYSTIDPAKVGSEEVIGSSDGLGLNTGIHAVKDVYPSTGYIPSFLLAPGFSSIPEVHDALYQNSIKINGHWDAYMLTDIPIVYKGNSVTLDGAKDFKKTHRYNRENETTYFPLMSGVDGKKYHTSVLAAANLQELLLDQDGIPYRSASNTECSIIENLYLGEENKGRIFDDKIINEKLNMNGIASAVYTGGRWAIWGAHSADYDQENANEINVAETNRMMLYYVSNDFQERRSLDVDKPMTPNDIRTVASEEQTRLDALMNIGALIYGEVSVNADQNLRSDIVNGDYSFTFNITTTPLAKSLTAIVSWTDDGFVTYFEDSTGE